MYTSKCPETHGLLNQELTAPVLLRKLFDTVKVLNSIGDGAAAWVPEKDSRVRPEPKGLSDKKKILFGSARALHAATIPQL